MHVRLGGRPSDRLLNIRMQMWADKEQRGVTLQKRKQGQMPVARDA